MHAGIIPCDNTYPELKASGDAAFNGLKTIIEEGQAQGVFRESDIEMLALTAWAGIHGLSMLAIGGNLPDILSTPVDNRAITDAVTANMLAGLKAD
jgi:hypothetical protein